ncbi:MAG: ABC transporter permease [Planctomycetes bacterium]|nr:ABC transporter permease [Planctomycetota bacterium]NOG53948.1 ABC transporter permease [Planctomycetota bacterium]
MPLPPNDSDSAQIPQGLFLRFVTEIGRRWLVFLAATGGVWYLFMDSIRWIWRAIVKPGVRLGYVAIISQVVRLGVRAIGIVILLSICIGAILSLQMEPPLADFSAEDKIANIIGIAVLRELGPLISAVILTGFAGAAVAAEIGTMVVGEEIEALEAHALNPVRFLVVPRVSATTFSMICLTVFADCTAIAAGMFVAVYFLGIPARLYWDNTILQCSPMDFVSGLSKAVIFGLLIGLISCYNGLRVTGGAAGVGRATTDTVVACIVSVIFADLVFTAIFYMLGWV